MALLRNKSKKGPLVVEFVADETKLGMKVSGKGDDFPNLLRSTLLANVSGVTAQEEVMYLGAEEGDDKKYSIILSFPKISLSPADSKVLLSKFSSALNGTPVELYGEGDISLDGYRFWKIFDDGEKFVKDLLPSPGPEPEFLTVGYEPRRKTLESMSYSYGTTEVRDMKEDANPNSFHTDSRSYPVAPKTPNLMTRMASIISGASGNIEYFQSRRFLQDLLKIASDLKAVVTKEEIILYGQAIYGTYKGELDGLVVWRKFAYDNGHDIDGFDALYSSFRTCKSDFMSISEHLRENANEKINAAYYQKYFDIVLSRLDKIAVYSAYNFATIFHLLFMQDFVYNDGDNKGWFCYENGLWQSDPQQIKLKTLCDISMYSFLTDYKQTISPEPEGTDELDDNASSSSSSSKKSKPKTKANAVGDAIIKSRDGSFKRSVFESLEPRLTIPGITKIFDTMYNCFQVANGVIEFIESTRTVSFRPTRRQDYSTISSKISYDVRYTEDHPDVVEVMDYYRKVIPDADTLECRLRWIGSGFYRGNHAKKYSEVLGEHNNSKSAEQVIIMNVFGGYYAKYKPTVFTELPTNASSADTSIVGLANMAFGVGDEPKRGDRIVNTTFFKTVTGGDRIRGRRIREAEMDFVIPAKMELVTNHPVLPQTGDPACDGRMMIFPYNTLFSDNAPDSEEEQVEQNHYPLDLDFTKKTARLYPAFMWVYVQAAKRWFEDNKNLRISDKMKDALSELLSKNDFYGEFLTERYEKSKKPANGEDEHMVPYNVFVAEADACLDKGATKGIYNIDVLVEYLKKWIGTKDIITVHNKRKMIKGIKRIDIPVAGAEEEE